MSFQQDYYALSRVLTNFARASALGETSTQAQPHELELSRDQLRAFAKSKGDFPGFLFDTILPEGTPREVTATLNATLGELTLAANATVEDSSVEDSLTAHRAAAESGLYGAVESGPVGSDANFLPVAPHSQPESKNKGGRHPTYNWNAMYAEILCLVVQGNLPKSKSDLVTHISKWFSESSFDGSEPATSEVHKRVGPIYEELKLRGWAVSDERFRPPMQFPKSPKN
jgi:hypothetical protein